MNNEKILTFIQGLTAGIDIITDFILTNSVDEEPCENTIKCNCIDFSENEKCNSSKITKDELKEILQNIIKELKEM